AVRDGAALLVAELKHRRVERGAARRVYDLWQRDEVRLGLKSRLNLFARDAAVHPRVAVEVEETRRHALEVEAFHDVAELERGASAIVSCHRLRRAPERLDQSVCDDERSRL